MPASLHNIHRDTLKSAVEKAGSPFFSPDTMRFFNSRLAEHGVRVGPVVFFRTSERYNERSPRLHTVRRATFKNDKRASDGREILTVEIDSVSGFQEYRSGKGAESRMYREAQAYAATLDASPELTGPVSWALA